MLDKDVKIYSGESAESTDFSNSVLENLHEHRKNGNIDRAMNKAN